MRDLLIRSATFVAFLLVAFVFVSFSTISSPVWASEEDGAASENAAKPKTTTKTKTTKATTAVERAQIRRAIKSKEAELNQKLKLLKRLERALEQSVADKQESEAKARKYNDQRVQLDRRLRSFKNQKRVLDRIVKTGRDSRGRTLNKNGEIKYAADKARMDSKIKAAEAEEKGLRDAVRIERNKAKNRSRTIKQTDRKFRALRKDAGKLQDEIKALNARL